MERTLIDPEYEAALKAKIRYISRLMTKQEIAKIARVSQEDVDLFERGQPVNPAAERKLLNVYRKTINRHLFDRFFKP